MLIARYIIGMHNAGTNKNDIASYLYSYLKEDVLYAQLLFVNGYITGFLTSICGDTNRSAINQIVSDSVRLIWVLNFISCTAILMI